MINKVASDSNPGFKAINLACGGKLCHLPGWMNADQHPRSREVTKVNLLKALPFPTETFDIVYHSQFIEHLPPDRVPHFLSECYRILKQNGIMRIVTPDLENQAKEYLHNLGAIMRNESEEEARLRYDWIRLEMIDQISRHKSGGEMIGFLRQSGWKIKKYLLDRLGRSGDNLLASKEMDSIVESRGAIRNSLKVIKAEMKRQVEKPLPDILKVGKFRMSGEPHLCIYDRYLLPKVLMGAGFTEVRHVDAQTSRIEDWHLTLLDSDKLGNPDCPASLFMEAVRPF